MRITNRTALLSAIGDAISYFRSDIYFPASTTKMKRKKQKTRWCSIRESQIRRKTKLEWQGKVVSPYQYESFIRGKDTRSITAGCRFQQRIKQTRDTQRTHGENNTTRAKHKTRTTEENEPDDTEERTPTMIRASSTGLISEPNGKLKAGKTRHRCGQQEDGRRIGREAQEIGEIHRQNRGYKKGWTKCVALASL